MTTRMTRLPPGARVASDVKKKPTKRAHNNPGRFRCAGACGCGEIIEGSWASMERHLDSHGGHRAEVIL